MTGRPSALAADPEIPATVLARHLPDDQVQRTDQAAGSPDLGCAPSYQFAVPNHDAGWDPYHLVVDGRSYGSGTLAELRAPHDVVIPPDC